MGGGKDKRRNVGQKSMHEKQPRRDGDVPLNKKHADSQNYQHA